MDNIDYGYSDKEFGFASPVTVAGSKKIEEPYKNIRDMPETVPNSKAQDSAIIKVFDR